MQARNIVSQNIVLPYNMESFNSEIIYIESQNNPLRKCIIVGFLVVPLFNMATAVLSQCTKTVLLCQVLHHRAAKRITQIASL